MLFNFNPQHISFHFDSTRYNDIAGRDSKNIIFDNTA